jgi:hypothetical protein
MTLHTEWGSSRMCEIGMLYLDSTDRQCTPLHKPYKSYRPKCDMSLILGMSPGIFVAWIVGFITIVLALLYPLLTKSEEGA